MKMLFKGKIFCIFLLLMCITGCTSNNKSSNKNINENTVTAENKAVSAESEVKNEEVINIVKEVDLSKYEFADMNLAVDCTFDLKEICNEEGLTIEIEKADLVSVLDGYKIKALSEGKTAVTIKSGNQSAQFKICITNPQISMTEVYKIVGKTATLTVYGTTGTVEWESDNEAIATVEDGVVYAMPAGCGMSTTIHAYVDGKDLECKVNVEPVPQLSTTYKIYENGKIENIYEEYNYSLSICSNTNKISTFTEEQVNNFTTTTMEDPETQEVFDLNSVDYSNGTTFPVYETYIGHPDYHENYIKVFLVGTSQDATVVAQCTDRYTMDVAYDANEGFGTISVWVKQISYNPPENVGLVHIRVDDIDYCINIRSRGIFNPYSIDALVPKSDVIEEFVKNDVVEKAYNGDFSEIKLASSTFIPNNKVGELGEMFIDKVQDKAVDMCVDLLFTALFPF